MAVVVEVIDSLLVVEVEAHAIVGRSNLFSSKKVQFLTAAL